MSATGPAGSGASWSHLPDVLEEHLDELGFLWGVRQADLRSPDEPLRSFLETEERVEAHLRGVLVVGEAARDALDAGLEADDPLEVFAAALSLLHTGTEGRERVLEAFRAAEPDGLPGLRMALAHGPLREGRAVLRRLADAADEPRAVAAAEVLAFHGALEEHGRLAGWRTSGDAGVREAGWRLTGYLGHRVEPRVYAAGARDEVPAVRAAVLEAAAWAGEPGVLQVGRSVAAEPSVDDLPPVHLLAVLGEPEDLPLFRAVGRNEALGPARFDLVAAYGSPTLVPLVLEGLTAEDPAVAVAAGRAFTKMTGVDVTSQEVVELPLEEDDEGDGEGDEMDAEFTDPVALPDASAAREAWDRMRPGLEGVPRIGRGQDLRSGVVRERFPDWDMQSRWELFLRARHGGRWNGSSLQLEVFPQRGRGGG